MHMWGAVPQVNQRTLRPAGAPVDWGVRVCVRVCVCVFRTLALGEYLWACLRSQAQILESHSESSADPTALEDPDR